MFLLCMKHEPDDLDQLLQSWQKVPTPSGRLTAPVWRNIEATGGRASWFGNLTMALRELDLRIARPAALATVVAFALLVGLGLAELRSLYTARRIDTEMSTRYLSMIDVDR